LAATYSGPWQGPATSAHRSLALDAAGDLLAITGNGVTIINLKTGLPRTVPMDKRISFVCFLRNNKSLVTVSEDAYVQHWDIESGEKRAEWHLHEVDFVSNAALSPDEKTLLSTGKDFDNVDAWETDTTIRRATFGGKPSNAYRYSFSPDGKWVLCYGSFENYSTLWDATSFVEKQQLGRHGAGIRGAAFAPNGRLVATCSDDGVRVWEVPSGKLAKHLRGQAGPANCLSFGNNGRTLAVGHGRPTSWSALNPGYVEIWDVDEERVIARWKAWERSHVVLVSYCIDSSRLVTVDTRGEVKIWDMDCISSVGKQ
jgi:WD40 repeat protein